MLKNKAHNPGGEYMNISSVIVHTYPQEMSELQQQLESLPGVDVHAAMDDGRIIITIEDTPESVPAKVLMNVQNLQGVLSAAMVYNYCDDQSLPTQE